MKVKSKVQAWEVIKEKFNGVDFVYLVRQSQNAGYPIYEGIVEDFFGYEYGVHISDCNTKFEVTRMDNGKSTNIWIQPDRTLEEIIKKEQERRSESGMFGIAECKKAILNEVEYSKQSLYQLLEKYVDRSNEDCLFNSAMVLACWELINKR